MNVPATNRSSNSKSTPLIGVVVIKNFFVCRSESNKENSPRSSKKSTDENIADDNAVQRARAELRVLEQERSKLEKQRKAHLKDFETSKADARRLLEVSRIY